MSKNETYNYSTFESMDLNKDLLAGIKDYGIEKPSEIQQLSIKPIINGEQVIIKHQSGTGKSFCLVIGALQRLLMDIDITENGSPKVLMIFPNREITLSTKVIYTSLSKYIKGINIMASVSGNSLKEDIDKLKSSIIQVFLCTPGRGHDLINRGFLSIRSVKMVIFDEIDQQFLSGFKDPINDILSSINGRENKEKVQVVLSTYTINDSNTQDFIDNKMNQPTLIQLESNVVSLEKIKQFYINVNEEKYKCDTLVDLIQFLPSTAETKSIIIIFCNSRARVKDLALKLKESNIGNVYSFIGEESFDLINSLKDDSRNYLITTDLFYRMSLNDIEYKEHEILLVINYDLPNNIEEYLPRAKVFDNHSGFVFNFVTDSELDYHTEIQRYYSTYIQELPEDFSF